MKPKLRPTAEDLRKPLHPAAPRAKGDSRILLRPRRTNDAVTQQWGQIMHHIDSFMAERSEQA